MWLSEGTRIVFGDEVITQETLEAARASWGDRSIRPCTFPERWSDHDALMAWLVHQVPFGLMSWRPPTTFTATMRRVGCTHMSNDRFTSADYGLRLVADCGADDYDIENERGNMVHGRLKIRPDVVQFEPAVHGLCLEICPTGSWWAQQPICLLICLDPYYKALTG